MDFPVLNGPRIFLRRVEADRPADVEAMHRCYQCPEVHRYTQGEPFGWRNGRKSSGAGKWSGKKAGLSDGGLP